eukprot:COSAG02_NODE_19636_length_872_cov_0.794308_2_plen_78_part_01
MWKRMRQQKMHLTVPVSSWLEKRKDRWPKPVHRVQRQQWLTQLHFVYSPRLHYDLPFPANDEPKSCDDTGHCCQYNKG